jgi:hypothetical protein
MMRSTATALAAVAGTVNGPGYESQAAALVITASTAMASCRVSCRVDLPLFGGNPRNSLKFNGAVLQHAAT